jgi:hypothetical protein
VAIYKVRKVFSDRKYVITDKTSMVYAEREEFIYSKQNLDCAEEVRDT